MSRNTMAQDWSDIPSQHYPSDDQPMKMQDFSSSPAVNRRAATTTRRQDENRYNRYDPPHPSRYVQSGSRGQKRALDSDETISSATITGENKQISAIMADLGKLKKEVRGTAATVKEMKTSLDSLQKGVENIIGLVSSVKDAQSTPSAQPRFERNYKKPQDAAHAKRIFWAQADYNTKKANTKGTTTTISTSDGSGNKSGKSTIPAVPYILELDGTPVDAALVSQARSIIRAKLNGKWNKENADSAPATAGKIDYDTQVDIANAVEAMLKPVAFAEGHWKAIKLIGEVYTKWHDTNILPHLSKPTPSVKAEPTDSKIKAEPGTETRPAKKARLGAATGVSGLFKSSSMPMPTPASFMTSSAPTPMPSAAVSVAPTPMPSAAASVAPTPMPSAAASAAQTRAPTPVPSTAASVAPTPMPSAAASVAPTRAPTPVPSTAAPTPAILPNAFAGELDVLTAMTSPLEAAVNGEAAAPTAIPVAVKNPLDSAKLSGISRFLQAPPPPIPTSAPAPGSFTGVIDPLLDGPSAPALDPLSGCLSTPSTSTAVLQPWEEIHVTGQRNRAYKPKAFGTQGFAYQEYFGAEWAKGRTGATRGGFVDAWNALPAEAKKGYYDTWLIADSQKKARKTKKGAN